jgi:protein-tyrosine kinase
MSIIETALGKVQRQSPSSSRAGGAATAQLAAVDSAAEQKGVVEFVPRSTLTLDMARMTEQGYFPSDAYVRDRMAQEFRRMRLPIIEAAAGRHDPPIVNADLIQVTSSVPAEGKTFVSTNLAMSLARNPGTRVLLIDADLARPQLSKVLGLLDQPGLTDLLCDKTIDPGSLILGTDRPGLLVLPVGKAMGDAAADLLGGQRLTEIVAWVRSHIPGCIVLFDSPPLLATTDAQVLSRSAGQVLLVVRADSTPRPVVAEALSLLTEASSVACILNQASQFGSNDYYGKYQEYARGREA